MDFQKLVDSRNKFNPFVHKVGIHIDEVRLGWARAHKVVDETDLNPARHAHGGVLFSLADATGGIALGSRGYQGVTVNSSFSFFRGADVGDCLYAEAKEIKAGRLFHVYNVDVTNQHGVLLATGTFTFHQTDVEVELID